MKQKALTYTFYYWGPFFQGAFVLDPFHVRFAAKNACMQR